MAGLERVVFVLDRPKEPANVGAVVRLLGNFGLSRLRLIEPAAFDEDQVRRFARRGEVVLSRVERYSSLETALADCTIVLGTTRRDRALQRTVLTPREAPGVLLAVAGGPDRYSGHDTAEAGLAAVLFGPEDFGLPNTALDHCHAIITIPTAIGDASLNLAQAALVVAYELFLATSSSGPRQPEPPPAGTLSRAVLDGDLAPAAELDALFEACQRTLVELYEPHIPGRTKVTIARMRALLLRAAPRSDEARLLTTMFEHIVRKMSRSPH